MMAQDSLFVPCQHLRTNCTSVAETYVHMTLVNRKRQFFVLFFFPETNVWQKMETIHLLKNLP